jgi:predicted PurR-regulated permease PerM
VTGWQHYPGARPVRICSYMGDPGLIPDREPLLPPQDRVPPTEDRLPARRETRGARITFGLLVLVAAFLFVWVIWPFRAPLFLAVVLAAVLQRPLERLSSLLRGRRRTASALLTLAVLFVIVIPLGSIGAFAVRESLVGLQYLRDELGVQSVQQLRSERLPPRAEAMLDRVLRAAHLTRAQVTDGIARVSESVQAAAPEVLASSGRAAFHTVAMLLALYFLLLDGRRVVEWLWSVSPLQARQTRELMTEFRNVSHASIVGTAVAALFQGIVMAIGMAIVGIPHALFFGLLTAVASFIPVVGTAIVWVPACVILAVSGHATSAIVLAIWSLILVVGGEHVGKPLLLKGGVEMHTGLVFLSLLGGLEVFGLLGIILGPLIFAFFLALLRMYRRDFQRQAAEVH